MSVDSKLVIRNVQSREFIAFKVGKPEKTKLQPRVRVSRSTCLCWKPECPLVVKLLARHRVAGGVTALSRYKVDLLYDDSRAR